MVVCGVARDLLFGDWGIIGRAGHPPQVGGASQPPPRGGAAEVGRQVGRVGRVRAVLGSVGRVGQCWAVLGSVGQ